MSKELMALVEANQKEIYHLLQSLPIDPDLVELCFEDIRMLSEKDALQQVYLMYPRLFSTLFFDEEDQKRGEAELTRLCLAGFFVYRFVVKSDAVFDRNSRTFNDSDLLGAFAYQEEGIRLLSTLFNYESSFWRIWNRRRKELAQAVALDNTMDELDWDLYEILADCKSTFGKIAIDAVHLMKGERKWNEAHQQLLNSHRYFSVGFQILDDIQDFSQDLLIGQTNIGLLCLADKMAVPYRSLFEIEDKDALHQQFVAKELDQRLLEKAVQYFERSKQEVASYAARLPLWMEVIELKLHQALELKGAMQRK